MTRIRFTRSTKTLLGGADALLVVAPRARLRDGAFLDATLPDVAAAFARDLASDVEPGLGGAAAGTLTGDRPRKLAVGVLPDAVSRHNAPSRAEAIRRVVAQSSTGRSGKAAILVALDDVDHVTAAALAIGKALPLMPRRVRRGEAQPAEPRLNVLFVGPSGAPVAPPRALQALVDAQRGAGRHVDMAPTELDPAAFHAEAAALAKGLDGVTVKAIVGDALLREKLGGIHAVGRAAASAPRLVVLRHRPAKARKGGPHVALVGKGITYDTGGLSLKIGGTMVGMKADMGGAAAVLGAFAALVEAGAPCEVSALLCLAENAIGPASYKNDDVIEMHSGFHVEINNTDAEGRMLLADGVSYAARKLGADVVVDIATLTGAQGVATGVMHAALLSDDEALEGVFVEAGRRSGDLVHPLPFAPEFHRDEFKSQVAHMKNSVANRANAQVSCAAEFVHWHLDGTDARWAHVDMAFPARRNGRGTGFGVGLLAEAVRGIAAAR